MYNVFFFFFSVIVSNDVVFDKNKEIKEYFFTNDDIAVFEDDFKIKTNSKESYNNEFLPSFVQKIKQCCFILNQEIFFFDENRHNNNNSNNTNSNSDSSNNYNNNNIITKKGAFNFASIEYVLNKDDIILSDDDNKNNNRNVNKNNLNFNFCFILSSFLDDFNISSSKLNKFYEENIPSYLRNNNFHLIDKCVLIDTSDNNSPLNSESNSNGENNSNSNSINSNTDNTNSNKSANSPSFCEFVSLLSNFSFGINKSNPFFYIPLNHFLSKEKKSLIISVLSDTLFSKFNFDNSLNYPSSLSSSIPPYRNFMPTFFVKNVLNNYYLSENLLKTPPDPISQYVEKINKSFFQPPDFMAYAPYSLFEHDSWHVVSNNMVSSTTIFKNLFVYDSDLSFDLSTINVAKMNTFKCSVCFKNSEPMSVVAVPLFKNNIIFNKSLLEETIERVLFVFA
jgi:hypothetical protein